MRQVAHQAVKNAAPPMSIFVENIIKRYGTFEAVKGISFEVKDGEIFGLLGPMAPARAPSFA